jgi:hypothetical protein
MPFQGVLHLSNLQRVFAILRRSTRQGTGGSWFALMIAQPSVSEETIM